MIRTKTRRKQKKHGKTKKRIYGGGFLFDYSIWASKTITPSEKNEALNRIKSIVPNPKQPIRTGRLIKTALDELREKSYDKDIYDAIDSKIFDLITKKNVDLKDIFDDKNKGDLKKLTKTNNFISNGDVEMTELSSRPLMETKMNRGALEPDSVETPAQDPIPGDLYMPQELSGDGDDVGQSEVQDDRGLVVDETVKLSDEVKREADAAAEAERIAAEKVEADRIAAEKVEAERITAAEAERIAAEKVEAELKRVAAEQEQADRIAAEKAEAELKRVAAEQEQADRIAAEKAEAERIAAEEAERERVAAAVAAKKVEEERAAEEAERERRSAAEADRKRIAAKSLFDSANQSLGDIVDAVEVETQLDDIGAANKARLANITKEERVNAKSLFDSTNQSLGDIVEAAEVETQLNYIGAANKARLANITKKERANAELLFNTNKAEVPNDGPSDDDDSESSSEDDSDSVVSSNMSDYENGDESNDENGDNLPPQPPGQNYEAEIKQLHDDTDRLISEFNGLIEKFDYTNVDCERYYLLLYSLIKIHNQVKRNLAKIKGASVNVSEKYINQFIMISNIQTNIDSIYSISPLYQKGQRMIASLEYYTRNKGEYLEECQKNNIVDKERVAKVAKHSENRLFAPALKGYINTWMKANGEPKINPIQLRFPNDTGGDYDNLQMPPLEEINPSDTNINKLYVLRADNQLVTIDPKHIYAYEWSLLDDENTIAIIPDYMVNADGGEITAAEFLELLQLYYDIYERHISTNDLKYIKEMEGKDNENVLASFVKLLEDDAKKVREFQSIV